MTPEQLLALLEPRPCMVDGCASEAQPGDEVKCLWHIADTLMRQSVAA